MIDTTALIMYVALFAGLFVSTIIIEWIMKRLFSPKLPCKLTAESGLRCK